jgi:hypothetical protein
MRKFVELTLLDEEFSANDFMKKFGIDVTGYDAPMFKKVFYNVEQVVWFGLEERESGNISVVKLSNDDILYVKETLEELKDMLS